MSSVHLLVRFIIDEVSVGLVYCVVGKMHAHCVDVILVGRGVLYA